MTVSRHMHRPVQIATLLVLLVAALCMAILPRSAFASDALDTPAATFARPSTTGQLSVKGTQLSDAQGNPVVLKGVSTHGLVWYPEYVNEDLFRQLSQEWDANLVRLAMYTDDYVNENHDESLAILHKGIEAAIAADMYVVVDWHILTDNDPNQRLDEALEFFDAISREYADVPNVLYEICNEPNGDVYWSAVRTYADQVIPVIRCNSPQAVVVVGTPNYDRELMAASRRPLAYDNVMYVCHFYAATHGEDLREEVAAALDAGLPVFISECGLCESSGDGAIDLASAATWFSFLQDHKLSYAVWSLSNKDETSSFIKASSHETKHLADEDLSTSGLWVRSLLQGQDPAEIVVPTTGDDGVLAMGLSLLERELAALDLTPERAWPLYAAIACATIALGMMLRRAMRGVGDRRLRTYDQLIRRTGTTDKAKPVYANLHLCRALVLASAFFTLIYLYWRVRYSIPFAAGWLAVAGNLVLLVVEFVGLVESLVHYGGLMGMRDHPLPTIGDDEYPDVDIFIATYNEPTDLLYRTINGCCHLRYPDKRKVHIWVCDDNRRPEMRALAERMGVGYFDRPDNRGAKAGNLNNALAHTSAPYVVTLDADMIVRSDFLLKTIPYFVDAERRNATLPEGERMPLGFLQTPQSFYDPDVFQHALYSETRVPNEQDFFYRTIEVARTSTNSVIYGGSNTVLSRAALEAVGGFFTESITEDFATGLIIESKGFVSLATPEPLASGRTPHVFKEYIQQRTRWGRGVFATARKLGLMRRKVQSFSFEQRLSYWSSVAYWLSPVKNMVYVLSPLLFAVFNLPVFACTWVDLLVFWLPMHAAQSLCMRVVSGNVISSRWAGIYEMSLMPHLLAPIVKEMFGISLTSFKVTDKSGKAQGSGADLRTMAPFAVLAAASLVGLVRVIWLMVRIRAIGLVVLLFWLTRNAYCLLMAVFLVDGRESDGEAVRVIDAEPVEVRVRRGEGEVEEYMGVATLLTEHSVRVYLDEAEGVQVGDRAEMTIDTGTYRVVMNGVVVGLTESRTGRTVVHTIEILDFGASDIDPEYLQILYDRVPSLPQSLNHDWGLLWHLWRNIVFRAARTVQ